MAAEPAFDECQPQVGEHDGRRAAAGDLEAPCERAPGRKHEHQQLQVGGDRSQRRAGERAGDGVGDERRPGEDEERRADAEGDIDGQEGARGARATEEPGVDGAHEPAQPACGSLGRSAAAGAPLAFLGSRILRTILPSGSGRRSDQCHGRFRRPSPGWDEVLPLRGLPFMRPG